MSAFICSPQHIAVLGWLVARCPGVPLGMEQAVQVLAEANLLSVGHRYSHLSENEPDYGLPGILETDASGNRYPSRQAAVDAWVKDALDECMAIEYVDAIQYALHSRLRDVAGLAWWLSQVDCYEYQSCEFPGWLTSEARALILRAKLLLESTLCEMPLPGLTLEALRRTRYYQRAPWGIEQMPEEAPPSDPSAVPHAA